jgi:sirohydrochlorin cobaltochelatase
MKRVIILAMHGMPPNDFPQKETMEYFMLHSRLENMSGPPPPNLQQKYKDLDKKMRQWARTPENDPYFYASNELAEHLSHRAECPVIIGFNEFCSPSLDDAFEEAGKGNPEKIIIVTPMMTRGGEHSEKDIPEAVERAKEKYSKILFEYIWPFDLMEVASFLEKQIRNKN